MVIRVVNYGDMRKKGTLVESFSNYRKSSAGDVWALTKKSSRIVQAGPRPRRWLGVAAPAERPARKDDDYVTHLRPRGMDFLCRRACMEPPRREECPDTEVVVIGNGPAGLAVSAFLSGIHPYYDSLRGHPDDDVHRRLTRTEHASLIDQDLSWYEQKVMEQADRAMGYLYDTLARPSIDSGLHRPSCLRWAADPARAVPHVVLGATAPGGSWSTHDPEMVAVSVGGLLDLPGFPMAAWMQDMKSARERQPASVVAAYMRDYPRRVGISARVRSGTTVTRLEKTPAGLWRVSGIQASGRPFSLVARRVVLATGLMEQRMLAVEGEAGNARVVYTMQQLKESMAGGGEITDPTVPSSSAAAAATAALPPVIVVGDGISAADAVLFCMERGRRVVHVMRKNEHELRRSAGRLRSRFSATLYPEYYNVFELMQGRQKHALYERRVAARVEKIEGASAYLRTRAGVKEEPFSLLAACIGQRSTFEGVLSGGAGGDQTLPSSFGRDYRSEDDPSLFCVGSAVGDHYVRFLVGGCMHVAQQIVAEHEGGRNLVVDDPLLLDTVVGEDTVLPPAADAFLDGDDGLLEISC
ncbi:hypothetical protein PRIPAC_82473 [Pristionchus pacificus]|uniref:Pyridine nucleotide-disulfide oxidoreductase n=1 Tax=Pristionchus pacificus TaxID=54126 RepID=A0A2A6BXJ3_PRIPA|nr:hypothetical protein PRIPAC_82473 [Pristionchus pacificus]|eukprot:PDM70547.1 pyridine nucleotide-disulfide oxidoreductase [Pristionchus pacificus]